MATKTLTVALSADLYGKFMETVTEKGGRWRSRRKKDTPSKAIESAVTAALMLFLQGLDGETELPEFREYARSKYPEMDEEVITMFENFILRVREKEASLKHAREIGRREIEKKHPHFFED